MIAVPSAVKVEPLQRTQRASGMAQYRIRDAAVFAGAGLLGLGTGLPVRDFADAALALMSNTSIDSFAAAVKQGEEATIELTRDYDGNIAPLITTVNEVVMTHRMSLREGYSLEAQIVRNSGGEINGYAIAHELLKRGAELLVGLTSDELKIVRSSIAAIYSAYLSDPGSVEAMMPEVVTGLFELKMHLLDLDQGVREALLELRSDLLLLDGRRILPPWEGPDSWLLRAEYGVAPFHPARMSELDDIDDWATTSDRLAIRLLFGRGGAGKTRLALETVARHRQKGWRAGFLGRHDSGSIRNALSRLFSEGPSCLLIVDYAETRRDELVPIIEEAAAFKGERCRILLIARAKAEWWDLLCRSTARVASVMESLSSSYELGPLPSDTAIRESLYQQAVEAYGHALSSTVPQSTKIELNDDAYALPLFVHLAALANVRGRQLARGDELLDDVISRERRFWDTRVQALGLNAQRHSALVSQAVALVTLIGGCRTRTRVRDLVATVPLAVGLPAIDLDAISRMLCEIYPSPEDLGSLRPDVLGEELVAAELAMEPNLFTRAIDA